jgi:cysteine desulfurase
MPVYLDCNATAPLEPQVGEIVRTFLVEEFGNEGSRTHEFGARAKQAVQKARDQVAAIVGGSRDEVLFTSGATEANNMAILGLAEHGLTTNRRHLVTTAIEHKAVLEPMQELARRGFELTVLPAHRDGTVSPETVIESIRPDTLLVSVMAVNNETGVRQPIGAIADALDGKKTFFHTDAAQAFGKEIEALRHPRIDLISVSGHKIYGPKGIGALVTRRRGYTKPPLKPLMYGGGQERGLRPGTLPVALIAGIGLAAELAGKQSAARRAKCKAIKSQALEAFMPLGPRIHGPADDTQDHVLSIAFPGLDSEALMVALKGEVAVSNGSACTSSSYTPSHVLKAMGLTDDEANEAVRFSWCHLTPEVDWHQLADRIRELMS